MPGPDERRRALPASTLLLGLACISLRLAPGAFAGVSAVAPDPEGPIFVDVAAASGLDFVHFNGMSGELYFPEMTGQGGALFDYDGDGDLDAYLVNGAMLGPGKRLEDAIYPPRGPLPPRDRLFRNDLDRAAGGLAPRFVDVTEASRLDARGYGMGVATGDADGDGWVDLYVTNYGPNQLWRNNGDGTFSDWTEKSGTGDPLWGTSAAFVDYDADGDLDLYVVNYVEFDLERNPRCFATSSRRDYCGPDAFAPQPDRLFRNRGDGTFEDVTLSALLGYRPGPGLGVVAEDFDGDGRVDLYVANDGKPNQLWLARGDGTFREDALLAGAAVSREGRPQASMGVDAADFDQDGDPDLFMTHLMAESNTLYVNDGAGLFEDRTAELGLAAAALPYTAFGTGWIDYDADGRLDLVVFNGAVRILERQAAAADPFPLRQPNQLFRNTGAGFVEVTEIAGEAFARERVSRGAALGDVDNDGDVDVLALNNSGPAELLSNRVGGRWLGVVPLARPPGGPAPGARVEIARRGGPALLRRAKTDGGYCSAGDPRLAIGIGELPAVAVEIRWPGGNIARWKEPPERRYLVASPPRAGDRR